MKKLNKNLQNAEILDKKGMKEVTGGFDYPISYIDDGDNTKVEACTGKEWGTSCSFMYNGNKYHGRCMRFMFDYGPLHCSDGQNG